MRNIIHTVQGHYSLDMQDRNSYSLLMNKKGLMKLNPKRSKVAS